MATTNLSRRAALAGGLTGAAYADEAASDPLVTAVRKLHAAYRKIDDRVPRDEDIDEDHRLWQVVDAAYADLLTA